MNRLRRRRPPPRAALLLLAALSALDPSALGQAPGGRGPGRQDPGRTPVPKDPDPTPATTAPDAAVAATAAALQRRAQDFVDALVRERGLPGVAAAFVGPGDCSGAVVAGHEDAARERPLTREHRFLSGSIGKTYVAAVALQLVAEGELALDGRLADVLGDEEWYPRLPGGDTVTVRQLLNHTSGIPEHVWKPAFQQRVIARPDAAPGPAECVAFVLDDELRFAPGTGWGYADTNYVLVGLAIEKVTGRGYYAELRRRVLDPLQLTATLPSTSRALPGLANGHASGLLFTTGDTVQGGRYFVDPSFEYCGGGICSTPLDLARWGRALFAGDVVPATLRDAHRDGVVADPRVTERYGLGCFVMTSPLGPAYGHSGVMPGYLSMLAHYPDVDLTVALMWNTDDVRKVGRPRRAAEALAKALASAPGDADGRR